MSERIELRVNDLHLQAGQTPIVSGLGLSFASGEVVGLMGPSGSGKSMTATALLGMLPRSVMWTAGTVTIHQGSTAIMSAEAGSAPPDGFAHIRGRVLAYLPQAPQRALDPTRRIGAQIRNVASHFGHDPNPAVWLERAHLEPSPRILSSYPHQVSGGMAQRIVMAQTLAMGSRLWIADEPTSALDPVAQSKTFATLRAIADQGIGILLISHDRRAVRSIADRNYALAPIGAEQSSPSVDR